MVVDNMAWTADDVEKLAAQVGDALQQGAGAAARPLFRPLLALLVAGRPVDTVTVKALLNVALTEVRDVAYRFCRIPECPTVYYAAHGGQTFDEPALRERVHQKHRADDAVFVCYCFRRTLGSIRAELRETGRSTAVVRITAGINAGRCACEIRNPQGTCCLGNVRAVVERVKALTAAARARPATVGAGG